MAAKENKEKEAVTENIDEGRKRSRNLRNFVIAIISFYIMVAILYNLGILKNSTSNSGQNETGTQPRTHTLGNALIKEGIAVRPYYCALKGISKWSFSQLQGMHYTISFEVINKGNTTLYYNPHPSATDRNLLILNDNYNREFRDNTAMCFPSTKSLYDDNLEPGDRATCSFTILDSIWASNQSIVVSEFDTTLILKEYSWNSRNFSNHENFSFIIKTEECSKDY